MTGKSPLSLSTWLICLVAMCLVVNSASTVDAANNSATKDVVTLARKYFLGDGVEQNGKAAFLLYSEAAKAGNADGCNGVGACYARGVGVEEDLGKARDWFRRAAKGGSIKGQLNFAHYLWEGIAGDKDSVGGLAWFWIAASLGSSDGEELAVDYAKRLKSRGVLIARRKAVEWLKNVGAGVRLKELDFKMPGKIMGSGTAFFITRDGYLLTARHVVLQGRNIWIMKNNALHPVEVVAVDSRMDLALLKTDGIFNAVPLRDSDTVCLGEPGFTLGFPNVRIQGIKPKLTSGEISSLAGVQDARNAFQISVPVQPGNSGGPLMDADGNAIGVVNATLDMGDDSPTQNVNYAMRIDPGMALLREVDGRVEEGTLSRERATITRSAIDKAKQAVALVLVF